MIWAMSTEVSTIVVAAVVATSALLTAWLTSRSTAHAVGIAVQVRRQETIEANDRQDLVAQRVQEAAEQAAKAAKLLREDNARVAESVAHVATVTAETAAAQLGKLDVVENLGRVTHALVNSDKTELIRDKRDSLITQLVLMRELSESRRDAGREPSPEFISEVDALQVRIHKLERAIEERLEHQRLAEQQVAQGIKHLIVPPTDFDPSGRAAAPVAPSLPPPNLPVPTEPGTLTTVSTTTSVTTPTPPPDPAAETESPPTALTEG